MTVIAHYTARDVSGTTLIDLSGNGNNATLISVPNSNLPYLSVIGAGAIISMPDLFNGVTDGYTIGFSWSKWGKNYSSARNFHAYNTADIGTSSIYLSYSTGASNYVIRDSSSGAYLIAGNTVVLGQAITETITHASNGDIIKYENGAIINSSNIYYPENISRERTYIASGNFAYSGTIGGGNVLFDNFVFCDYVCSSEKVGYIDRVGTPEPYYYEGDVTFNSLPQSWELYLVQDSTGIIVDTTTSSALVGGSYKLYTPYNETHTIYLKVEETGEDNEIRSKRTPDGQVT